MLDTNVNDQTSMHNTSRSPLKGLSTNIRHSRHQSFNQNDLTTITSGSAFKNAAVIFQKIESTTQRVTGEILENQKQFKEYMNQKKELMVRVEVLKQQALKAVKDNIKIKDKIPKYNDVTAELSSRLVHKRGKSMESIKDITMIKQSIKQVGLISLINSFRQRKRKKILQLESNNKSKVLRLKASDIRLYRNKLQSLKPSLSRIKKKRRSQQQKSRSNRKLSKTLKLGRTLL